VGRIVGAALVWGIALLFMILWGTIASRGARRLAKQFHPAAGWILTAAILVALVLFAGAGNPHAATNLLGALVGSAYGSLKWSADVS
jgi:hypothetical protein